MSELNDTTRENLEAMRGYWQKQLDDGLTAPWIKTELMHVKDALAAGAPLTDEQWDDYFTRLAGPTGCDFEGNFNCKSGIDKTYSTSILCSMGLDQEQTESVHRIVDALGGHCDCEIVMNAAPRILPTWDARMPEVPS